MLEHIFRNINDIRVFDLMNDFDENCDITFDDVLELLEYTETERIQIEDSIEHLIKEQLLGTKQAEVETMTGCRICKLTDKLKIPRLGSHKNHVPLKKEMGYEDAYYIKDNDMTRALRGAVFEHISLISEQYIERKE